MARFNSNYLFPSACLLGALAWPAVPLAAQQSAAAEQAFINGVNTAISQEVATLTPTPTQRVIIGGNLVESNGARVTQDTLTELLDYIDGLKAAGAQRVELNPGITTVMSDAGSMAKYDAMVAHIRALGMQLAINPIYDDADPNVANFAAFQTLALPNYQLMAQRYQPENFVVVHEPDTNQARMGFNTTIDEWVNFVLAATAVVKAASPHTRVGAGCYYNPQLGPYMMEAEYFHAFALSVPACNADNLATGCLDFMTMDMYSEAFPEYVEWIQEAHSTGKAAYLEEVWAPHDLPPNASGNPDSASLVGPVNADFAPMDINWLQGMLQFASYYGLESMTAFTTEAFFLYGPPGLNDNGLDMPDNPTYLANMATAIEAGQLTSTGQAYLADSQQYGIKIATSLNSASYPTQPTVFDPDCGTATNPCNPVSTVAPDTLVSAFGADVANATLLDGTFPTTLGGTTVTMVDSSNTTYQLPLYNVIDPGQVNYYVPSTAAVGPATITVTSGDGAVSTGWISILPVAPGLYTASQNGQGIAAGIAVCTGTCAGWPNPLGNNQFYQLTFSGTNPVPLSVAAGDTVVVELYGTGIRHLSSPGAITATINGQSVPVNYAGSQNVYKGLDQVNVQIPSSFSGSGVVNVVLSVNDTVNNIQTTLNTVTLDIQ